MDSPRYFKHGNGFGLVGLLVVIALVAAIAFGGGLYFSNSTGVNRSSIDVSREALRQAKQLQEIVRTREPAVIEGDGTQLNLSNQGLTKVPSYVFGRTELTALNLSGNQLTGALPGEIRALKNLRELNVSHNNMTGIPAEVGALDNLEVLDYSYNQITGMPYEIGKLKNLKTFNLTNNDFSEQDLAIITKDLPNLRVIY